MLSVKVTTNIRVNEAGARSTIRLTNASVINRIQERTKQILKQNAPVRTGEFRESIIIQNSKRRETGGIFQGFALIGPTAPHSKFVVRKTRPSEGVYVPALDARIRFGRHPGTRANNFIKRSLPRINAEAQRIANQVYGKGRFDITRFIK